MAATEKEILNEVEKVAVPFVKNGGWKKERMRVRHLETGSTEPVETIQWTRVSTESVRPGEGVGILVEAYVLHLDTEFCNIHLSAFECVVEGADKKMVKTGASTSTLIRPGSADLRDALESFLS